MNTSNTSALLLLFLFWSPLQTRPLPDAESLRKELPHFIRIFTSGESALNGATSTNFNLFGTLPVDESLNRYSYLETHTTVVAAAKGKAQPRETAVYEVIRGPEEWQLYRRRISKNGVSLSTKDLEKQDSDQKARDERERARRRRMQEQTAKADPGKSAREERKERQNASEEAKRDDEIRALYELQVAWGQPIDGRSTILLTLKAKKDFKPKVLSDLELKATLLEGTLIHLWITQNEHEVVRADAEVVDAPINLNLGALGGQLGLGKLTFNKGTKTSFERRLINNEAWLPIKTIFDLDVGYRALVLVHGTGKARLITEYSDFKKYDVDTILKFGEPAVLPK